MKNTNTLKELKELFNRNKDKALQDYFTFLRFKSISSEPDFKSQTLACAEWVANYLREIGFDIDLWQTPGYPTIFGNYDKAGPSQPTLLIYNHYDVQPVDPLDLWQTPPFEPNQRNGQIYARGAQDNKGQCFYVMLALKTLMQHYGKLPINIKLCIEGEEECGSAGLSEILKDKRDHLKADYLAIVDLGLPKPTTPALTLGIRGIVAMDFIITGTKSDIHSGSHGGLAYNPIHALTKVLAMLRDPSGKITIPGFYDDVVMLSPKERSAISLEFDAKAYEEAFGAKPTGGELEYSPLERNWMRPTLEINGISGGYGGDGFKTVIPSKAFAKISCRLVPKQDPQKIGQLVTQFLKSNTPEGVEAEVYIHPGSGKAMHTRPDSKAVKAFSEAYEEVFQAPCEFIYSGASIPIVTELSAASGSEVVLLGMGLPDDLIHAPNEHFGVDRIEKGFLVISRAIQILAK